MCLRVHVSGNFTVLATALLTADFTQAFTAVSGKLILAKCVHSVNEKEEEEQVFFLSGFFSPSLLVTFKADCKEEER